MHVSKKVFAGIILLIAKVFQGRKCPGVQRAFYFEKKTELTGHIY